MVTHQDKANTMKHHDRNAYPFHLQHDRNAVVMTRAINATARASVMLELLSAMGVCLFGALFASLIMYGV